VHDHTHAPAEHGHADANAEGGWAPSRPGSVALDIGGRFGALVLLVPDDLAGHEIEVIDPRATVMHPVHTAVRERILPGGSIQAAVFQSLEAGHYRLALRGDRSHHPSVVFPEVEVTAGRVTEVDLS
jgi:hypothetical protein